MTYDEVMEGIVDDKITPQNETQKDIYITVKNQFNKWWKACTIRGCYDSQEFFIGYGGAKDEADMIKRIEEEWDCEQL